MNIAAALVALVVPTTLCVAAMLLMRRRAPEGGYFADGDRAAGVFGVLATGFSVLLGFLIFLTFDSYDSSRRGAEEEALTVTQQIETAQLLPDPQRAALTGELVCYARYVVAVEWPMMESDNLDAQFNPWGVAMFETVQTVEPASASQDTAFAKFLDQASTREVARNDRVHGASGVIPRPLWVALFLISAIVFVYMLCFADRGERAVIQAVLMGSVASVIAIMLILLQLLDDPYHDGPGSVHPVAMERTLRQIDQAMPLLGDITIPCDVDGAPTS